jgi:hypothetical protein
MQRDWGFPTIAGACLMLSVGAGPCVPLLMAVNADIGTWVKLALFAGLIIALVIVATVYALRDCDNSARAQDRRGRKVIASPRVRKEHEVHARTSQYPWPSLRAELLLDFVLPPKEADEIIGDLRERFAIRVDRYENVSIASIWHWRQVVQIVINHLVVRCGNSLRSTLEYFVAIGYLANKLMRWPVVAWGVSRVAQSQILSDFLNWVRSLGIGK